MLTQADIERHVRALRFAGLTPDQEKALDKLVKALEEAQSALTSIRRNETDNEEYP